MVAMGEGVGTLLLNAMKSLYIMRLALPLLESSERPSNANIVRVRAGWACCCHGGRGGDAYDTCIEAAIRFTLYHQQRICDPKP